MKFLLLALGLLTLYWMVTPASNHSLPAEDYNNDRLTSAPLKKPNDHAYLMDVTLLSGISSGHIQRSEQLSGLHESLGAGACALDYDNDGWMDLLLLNGSGTTHFYGKPQWWQENTNAITLYRNTRDGRFRDVTESSGLRSNGWSMGCAYGDVDNDGHQDLVISHYGQNELWHNNGDGTFTEMAIAAGITGEHWSTSIDIVDVNRDGLADIYVNNFIDFTTNSLTFEAASGYEANLAQNFDAGLYNPQANQLFINQGNLTFTEQAKAFGVDNPQGRSLSALWADINDDGFTDVMITNANGSSNKVLLNQAGQRFENITTASRLGFVDKTSTITIADINNQAPRELFFATDHRLYPKLYASSVTSPTKNSPSYHDVADRYQLHTASRLGQSHWGSIAQDINLDGWLDLIVANGMATPNQNAPLIPRGQKNTLLTNQDGQRFINQSDKLSPHTESSDASRCVLSADFDNNGAPDIYFINNNGLGQLLTNTITQHRWLGVAMNANNTDAFGSKVSLTISHGDESQTIHRYYGEQQGFLCHGDPRIIFGLGRFPEDSQLQLQITWLNGKKSALTPVENNRYYTVDRKGKNTSFTPEKATNTTRTTYTTQLNITNPHYRLQVISWLIEQQKIALAKNELLLLTTHDDKAIRLSAFQLSQTLPVNMRDAFLQLAFNDATIDNETDNETNNEESNAIKIYAIEITRKTENELANRWLLKALEHPNADVACAAANAYGHFFDEEEAFLVYQYTALSPLIRLATQAESKKQVCAINALGKSEHYRAVQPLSDLLSADSQEVRLAAVKALGLLKEKVAIAYLMNRVKDQHETPAIRGEALISIKKINPQAMLTSIIEGNLSATENTVKNTFVRALHYAYYLSDDRIIVKNDIAPFAYLLTHLIVESPTNTSQQATVIESNSGSTTKPTIACDTSTLEKENLLSLRSLRSCLSDSIFYKTPPAIINVALAQSTDIRKNALRLIAPRKERWARDIVLSVLTNNKIALEEQKIILASLPKTPGMGLQRTLYQLVIDRPNNELTPYLLRYLSYDLSNLAPQQASQLQTIAIDELKQSLDENNEARAVALAEALYLSDPVTTMTLLTRQGMPYAQ